MRAYLPLLLLAATLVGPSTLSAWTAPNPAFQAPLHIQAVERRGLPPYEEGNLRLYRLDGGENRGIRVGDRLQVRRTGEGNLCHLKVVEVRAEWALASLEQVHHAYPLRGDMVLREDLAPLPGTPRPSDLAILRVPEVAKGSTSEAPPQEGLLWFLPTSREVSPAGLGKLAGWVQAWGTGGRWVIQVPADERVADAMQAARFESLKEALGQLGIHTVERQGGTRPGEGANHPVWVRHWD